MSGDGRALSSVIDITSDDSNVEEGQADEVTNGNHLDVTRWLRQQNQSNGNESATNRPVSARNDRDPADSVLGGPAQTDRAMPDGDDEIFFNAAGFHQDTNSKIKNLEAGYIRATKVSHKQLNPDKKYAENIEHIPAILTGGIETLAKWKQAHEGSFKDWFTSGLKELNDSYNRQLKHYESEERADDKAEQGEILKKRRLRLKEWARARQNRAKIMVQVEGLIQELGGQTSCKF